MGFTIEEINLIAIYSNDNRGKAIDGIVSALSYMDDEISEIAQSALNKLINMTDAEFGNARIIAVEAEERDKVENEKQTDR